MIQNFEFEVLEPFGENMVIVDQIGYIDLREAFATGSIPANLEASEERSNGIDEPSSISGRIDDVFSADRAAKAYKSSASSASSEVLPEGGESA